MRSATLTAVVLGAGAMKAAISVNGEGPQGVTFSDVAVPADGQPVKVGILDPTNKTTVPATVTVVKGGRADIVAAGSAAATVVLSASNYSVVANGKATSTITAYVTDQAGNPVRDGTLVYFSADAGSPRTGTNCDRARRRAA